MENRNITFNENGTISYVTVRRQVPAVEQSVGNALKDIVFTPNFILLGAASVASRSNLGAFGFKVLAESLEAKPILNMTVHDLLWGYEDRMLSVASKILPSILTFNTFGLLDRVSDKTFYN